MIVGAARAVIAPIDLTDNTPAPADNIGDFVALSQDAGAYPLVSPYRDLGAATDGSSYSHGRSSSGVEIQQETGAIMEEITSVARAMSLSMAEVDPANIQLVENADEITTIAAAAGLSAQKRVGMGSYTDLSLYRVALIGIRKKNAGIVVEEGADERGRFVVAMLNRVSLSADEQSLTFAKGGLASGPITVVAFPEPGIAGPRAYGDWYFEEAGTIAAGP